MMTNQTTIPLEEAPRDNRALARFLFHLGKGLWKSVPIIGPLVDELFYAQYENQLLQRLATLSDGDIGRIAAALPKLSEEALADHLQALSVDAQITSLTQFSRVLEDLHASRADILDSLSQVASTLEDLPSIAAMVRDLRARIDNRSAMEALLVDYESRRQAWLARLSANQRHYLDAIPPTYTPVEVLWVTASRTIPGCGYKEFRFRLHEFEWLGLVERRWAPPHSWDYRLLASGRS